MQNKDDEGQGWRGLPLQCSGHLPRLDYTNLRKTIPIEIKNLQCLFSKEPTSESVIDAPMQDVMLASE